MERMTFEKPLAPKEDSLKESVFFYGLVGVVRTCGIEAAVTTKHRGKEELVTSDQEESNFFHGVELLCPIDFRAAK